VLSAWTLVPFIEERPSVRECAAHGGAGIRQISTQSGVHGHFARALAGPALSSQIKTGA